MLLKSKELISELSGKIKTIIIINSPFLGRINILEYFESQKLSWDPFNITQNTTIKGQGDAVVLFIIIC